MATINNALDMLYLLSIRKYTVDELAQRLEMSDRAIKRLKESLVNSGYDITTEYGPYGGYYLDKILKVPSHEFTTEEKDILKNSLEYLVQASPFRNKPEVIRTLGKLSNQLFEYNYSVFKYYDDVTLNIDTLQYIKNVNTIERAIKESNYLEIKYNIGNKKRKYIFEPYHLTNMKNIWYVEGYDQNLRYLTLKVNRIQELQLQDRIFKKERYLPTSTMKEFGFKINPLKVKMEVNNASYISEYVWGEDQTIKWINEDMFILEVVFSNDLKAKSFLLENGPYIKILEPSNLKEWYIKSLEKILLKYNINA